MMMLLMRFQSSLHILYLLYVLFCMWAWICVIVLNPTRYLIVCYSPNMWRHFLLTTLCWVAVCLREPTLLDHCRASSWSCRAATIIGSLSTSPAFCSGNSSSFSSGGGGRGGGTSPSGKGGLGGACSSLTWNIRTSPDRLIRFIWIPHDVKNN